jgi:hypothetical protein
MEIFFIPAKTNIQRALSGSFQCSMPVPNQRLLMAAGAFISPEEPWHRRTRAKGVEKLLQDAAPSVKNLSELWSQLSKKLQELSQNPLVIALLLEDGSFEGRFFGLGSLLLKGESKQKILALQGDTVSLSAELIAGTTEMIFFEENVDKAEEIAILLQETEQALGKASVRRLLTTAPSEIITAPLVKASSGDTPKEVAVPEEPSPTWQQYVPWGVAALMTLLLVASFWVKNPSQNVAASKNTVVDTKPKFIPQPEEPVVEAKKVDKKKTPETPSTQPEASEPGALVLPLSLPTLNGLNPSTKPKDPPVKITPKTKTPEKTTKIIKKNVTH